MIVAEIIPITSSILTESLSYFSASPITPGTIVSIPLRKQEIRGIVISTSSVKNLKQNLRHQNFKMRNILKVHEKTVFSPAYLASIEQLHNYYLVNTGKLIDISYPKHITKNFDDFSYTISKNKTKNKHQTYLLQKPYTERINEHTQTILEKLSNNQSVQIICPTVMAVKKISDSLQNTFSGSIYLLHGKTSKKKLTETYKTVQKKPSIIISTPSFIDVPSHNKSFVILEHDSSSHYYRAVSPHIDLRILVEQYAKNTEIELLIADGVLRPFRFQQVKKQHQNCSLDLFASKKISFVNIHKTKPLKQTDVERIADIKKSSAFSPLSKEIKAELKKNVKNNEKVFCYVHKKALAPTIVCRDCGNIAIDPDSKTPYQLFIKKNKETAEKERIYVNSVTDKKIPAFDLCQFCKSWRLHSLGIGTDSVAVELKELFPDVDIVIIDSLNTKNQTEIKKQLHVFNENSGKTKILVGTQLALPYLENIDTSYIISLDSIFAQSSYTIESRVLSLIYKIYEKTTKKLLVQSRNVLSKKISDIVKNKYSKFIDSSLSEAHDFSIHPYGTLIKINHFCSTSDYSKLYKFYTELFTDYTVDMRTKNNRKKDYIEFVVLIHVKNQLWNINNQDSNLYQKLPLEERNINIEINPEIF